MTKQVTIEAAPGVKFGMVLACVISFTTNKSILWAILHTFLSWIYVIYFACTR